jgi:glycosyltransferase involved in cell wall biosynthesis
MAGMNPNDVDAQSGRKRLKIAVISMIDIMDKRNISGSPYICATLLQKYCGDVELIDKFRPGKITCSYLLRNWNKMFSWLCGIFRLRQAFWQLFGKTYEWERTPLIAKYYARRIEKGLKGKSYDVIFSPQGSFLLAYLRTSIPIIYDTDATFQAMVGFYPNLMNPTARCLREGNYIEKRALQNATRVIATSHWAARSMLNDYGIDERKISVIPPASLFDEIPPCEDVLGPKRRDVCELLFLGKDWERKGGVIALKAVEWLNQNHVKARLTIVGCVPRIPSVIPKEAVKIIGFLDQNDSTCLGKLQQLFLESHFLLVPTRAEACARVCSESSAYGLPIITTDVGGVSTAVRNHENGIMLSYDSDGDEYGKVIKELWGDENIYNELCVSTRKAFDTRLSSVLWAETVSRIMHDLT